MTSLMWATSCGASRCLHLRRSGLPAAVSSAHFKSQRFAVYVLIGCMRTAVSIGRCMHTAVR
eukprot:3098552-Prymnesium_polylepis.1